MKQRRPRILVVDSDQHQLDTVCRGLLLYGYRCQGELTIDAALDALGHQQDDSFELVLADLTMPGPCGIELVEQARQRWPNLPIVVIAGLASTAELEAVRALHVPLLRKPFGPDTLDGTIRRALAAIAGSGEQE
jgi:DNA-binding NtrC family response regulator